MYSCFEEVGGLETAVSFLSMQQNKGLSFADGVITSVATIAVLIARTNNPLVNVDGINFSKGFIYALLHAATTREPTKAECDVFSIALAYHGSHGANLSEDGVFSYASGHSPDVIGAMINMVELLGVPDHGAAAKNAALMYSALKQRQPKEWRGYLAELMALNKALPSFGHGVLGKDADPDSDEIAPDDPRKDALLDQLELIDPDRRAAAERMFEFVRKFLKIEKKRHFIMNVDGASGFLWKACGLRNTGDLFTELFVLGRHVGGVNTFAESFVDQLNRASDCIGKPADDK